MPTASLLVVGTEMLDPARADRNGPLARERLAGIGIPLSQIVRVEDREEAIAAAVSSALASSEVVIASGGLGPTGDDLTREGAARSLGRGVVPDEEWLAALSRRLEERGRPITEAGRRQALVVEGAEAVPNPAGLACGSWIESGGRVLVLLPGVSAEFAAMLDGFVLPRLRERFPSRPSVRTIRAIAAGLPEVTAEPALAPWYRRQGVAVSILPESGVLRITVTIASPPAEDAAALEAEARADLERGLGRHLVSLDGASLAERLGEELLARGWSVAVAESCTGGRAAHRLVSVPGASRWFLGGVVAYSNEAKSEILGVSPGLIVGHGAVSEPVALAMARGARDRFGASCGIGITGIAGPEGGTAEKPVGLVHLAAVVPGEESARRLVYGADRASVIELASNYALYALWSLVRGRIPA